MKFERWPEKPPIGREITRRPGRLLSEEFNVDKLGQLMNIATDLEFYFPSSGLAKPTGNCRRLRRLT
jgi:hypothetical protein